MYQQNSCSDIIWENTAHMCRYFTNIIPVAPYVCLTGKDIFQKRHNELFPDSEIFFIRENFKGRSPCITIKEKTGFTLNNYEQYIVTPVDTENSIYTTIISVFPDKKVSLNLKRKKELVKIAKEFEKETRKFCKWGKYKVFFAEYGEKFFYCGAEKLIS